MVMPSIALRTFITGLSTPRTLSKSPCGHASPILAASWLLSLHRGNFAYLPARRSATTGTTHGKHIDGFEYGVSGLPVELELLLASKRTPRGAEWGAIIDSYLPLKLRLGTENSPGVRSVSAPVHPINTLPQVLARAREKSKIDLLSYVGVYQGRWEAVIWLVKAMMENDTSKRNDIEQSAPLSRIWPSNGEVLDEMTRGSINLEPPAISGISFQSIMSGGDDSTDAATSLGQRSLAQIWQSLGTMILQAADRSPHDPSYSLIMTQVFRILGHLHHTNAFPDLIYNYASPADKTVLQRPPTLYLLSRRIMSLLSDVEFDLHWKQEVLKYQQQGYEISNTTFAPRIREFGPELWLDLVLWACVEGGWIREGAWIIGEMERRKAASETRWSVISWQEICAIKEPKLDWVSILRLQIERTRLNQVGGIGIATGTDSTVDMGTRTISQEVVLAIIDGLLNLRMESRGASSVAMQESIVTCKTLLERGHPSLDASLLNAMVLRIIETIGLDERAAPGVLQKILDIRTATNTSTAPAEPLISAQNADTDDTAAILGLLHRNLSSFADAGSLYGSLTALRKIQGITDAKRAEHIESFASEVKARLHNINHDEDLYDTEEQNRTATLSPQIPTRVLVAFLDLITESKVYDLGKWLLENEDVDGGVLDPEYFSDPNLQPALLRFATATADENLLNKILAEVEPPISEPVLHALLRCQVAMGKWPAVKELFEYFRKSPGMSWKASDAMAIARAILHLEANASDAQTATQITEAQDILTNLLQGQFNSPKNPSQPLDLSEPKLANQLGRIFKTLPNTLSDLVPDTPGSTNRAHTSVSVTPNAFNILLEALIDRSGPSAGKALWERWCREPGESPLKGNQKIKSIIGRTSIAGPPPDIESERVVTPTRYMLRNILRPIVRVRQLAPRKPPNPKERKSSTGVKQAPPPPTNPQRQMSEEPDPAPVRRPLTRDEQEILDWGIDTYRKLGLSLKEINNEIPGAFPRPR